MRFAARIDHIWTGAFYYCSNWVGSFAIPEGVKTIGENAFNACSKLTGQLVLPESVSSIGMNAFASCYGMTSIYLPDSLTEIAAGLFYFCREVTSIRLPNFVTFIGDSAFSNMEELQGEIIIPATCINIGINTFSFSKISRVSILGPATLGSNIFQACTILESVTLNNNIRKIPSMAFWGCSSLSSINLPSNLQEIESVAFSNTAITQLTIPNGIRVGANAFSNCTQLRQLTINNSSYYVNAFDYCDNLQEVTLNEGVTNIPNFENCNAITTIRLPSTFTNFFDIALVNCTALANVTIANGNANFVVENGVLYSYNKSTLIKYLASNTQSSFTLPESVTQIRAGAFMGSTVNILTPNHGSMTFDKWYTNSTYTAAYTGTINATTTTLYGKWKVNGFIIYVTIWQSKLTLSDGTVFTESGTYLLSGSSLSGTCTYYDNTTDLTIRKAVVNANGETEWVKKTYTGTVFSFSLSGIAENISIDVRSNSCFTGDMLVDVWDDKKKRRKKKKIKDITYGDLLIVWNFDEGKFDYAKPIMIMNVQSANRYTKLTFSDGSILKTIGSNDKMRHRLFNCDTNQFDYIGKGTPVGTIAFNNKGKKVKLVSIEFIDENVEYYNVITNRHFNLFANGILTSCRLSNMYKIKDMKYVKDGRKLNSRKYFSEFDDETFEGYRLSEMQDKVNNQGYCFANIRDYIHHLLNIKK